MSRLLAGTSHITKSSTVRLISNIRRKARQWCKLLRDFLRDRTAGIAQSHLSRNADKVLTLHQNREQGPVWGSGERQPKPAQKLTKRTVRSANRSEVQTGQKCKPVRSANLSEVQTGAIFNFTSALRICICCGITEAERSWRDYRLRLREGLSNFLIKFPRMLAKASYFVQNAEFLDDL